MLREKKNGKTDDRQSDGYIVRLIAYCQQYSENIFAAKTKHFHLLITNSIILYLTIWQQKNLAEMSNLRSQI